MAAVFSEYLGATPVIRVIQLARYSQKNGLTTPLLGGVMFDGATGSCADHTAEGILRFAAADGVLAKGMPVVEAGYGSFSLALALACRRLGHPLSLVMPGTVPAERQQLLRGLGAAIATTNPLYGRDGQLQVARQLAEEQNGYFVDQFDNEYNVEFHKRITGPTLLNALDGKLDIAVIGVGSAGTITGVGEHLKAWAGNVKIVAVEPHECSVLSGGFAGRHTIPGLGAGFKPGNYNPYIVDQIVRVPGNEAHRAASQLLLCEGLPAGPASGAVACAAAQLASQPENAGKRIIALLPTRQEL